MPETLESLTKSYRSAAAILLSGGVGILPTDTVYGLVAVATNKKAAARIHKLKKRDNKPGSLIAANIDQLVKLGIDSKHLIPFQDLWPSPLSVVAPAGENLRYLHYGLDSLPVRIPKDDQLIRLLQITGPLATSSANHTGMPIANNINEAYSYFKDDVDFYVDGGDLKDSPPSTIIGTANDGSIIVHRQGSVSVDNRTIR